jgi:hypothetical protein
MRSPRFQPPVFRAPERSLAALLLPAPPRWTIVIASKCLVSVAALASSDEPKLGRLSKPQTLSFFDLVQVWQNEKPENAVADQVDGLLPRRS